MKHIAAAVMLCAASFTAIAQQDVTFSADDGTFTVVSSATGKVTRADPFVSVELQRHTMRASKKFKESVEVYAYKVGLAFTNSSGRWDIARWSEPVKQDFVLKPGDTKLIPPHTALIPIDHMPSLKGYWLVLAIETTNTKKTSGFTYSHSQKGLF